MVNTCYRCSISSAYFKIKSAFCYIKYLQFSLRLIEKIIFRDNETMF